MIDVFKWMGVLQIVLWISLLLVFNNLYVLLEKTHSIQFHTFLLGANAVLDAGIISWPDSLESWTTVRLSERPPTASSHWFLVLSKDRGRRKGRNKERKEGWFDKFQIIWSWNSVCNRNIIEMEENVFQLCIYEYQSIGHIPCCGWCDPPSLRSLNDPQLSLKSFCADEVAGFLSTLVVPFLLEPPLSLAWVGICVLFFFLVSFDGCAGFPQHPTSKPLWLIS